MALTIVSPLVDVATIEQMGSWQPATSFLNTRRGIVIEQMTFAPGTAGAGTGLIYARNNNLYFVDATGAESLLNNAADVLVAISATDTTPGYAGVKIVGDGSTIATTVLNPGANEVLQLSFIGAAGLAYFSEAEDAATYNYAQLIPSNAAANFNLVLSPKGTGYISAQAPDGTVAGGNARGANSIDLQTSTRADASYVAQGDGSALVGGQDNRVGFGCFAGGGYNNDLTGGANSAVFGQNNQVPGALYSFFMGDGVTGSSPRRTFAGGDTVAINNTDDSFIFGTQITVSASSADHLFMFGHTLTQASTGDNNTLIGFNLVQNAGSYSALIGDDIQITAGGSRCYAIGDGHRISANSCFAVGRDNTLQDINNFAFGRNMTFNGSDVYGFGFGHGINTAVLGTGGINSAAIGINAFIESEFSIAFGVNYQTTPGDAGEQLQYAYGTTTDSVTPVRVTPGGSGTAYTRLQDDGAYAITVKVLARRTDADGENSYWICEALVTREAGTVAIVGQGWVLQHQNGAAAGQPTPSLSADNTNFSVNVDVLGEASKTIRWVAKIESLSNIG